jgi:hypothetical protein
MVPRLRASWLHGLGRSPSGVVFDKGTYGGDRRISIWLTSGGPMRIRGDMACRCDARSYAETSRLGKAPVRL